MYNKTIGIYMPTHNRVELLKKAVDSVVAQTYQNFKLFIVNDGSCDNTLQYLKSLTDPRISYISHEHPKGACVSRNEAIVNLNTELVTGLDDDDIFLPNRLADLLANYNENYAFICSGYYWNYGAHKKALFDDNRKISLSDALDLNQCSNQILVNRQKIIAVGGFDEKLPALQDHDLWVRLIAKYGSAYRVGKPSYIVNDDHSLDRISSVENKLNAIEIFEKKHDELMLPRNKVNFTFYKNKIKGNNFSFIELIKSSRYGLVKLKARQYLSQYFKSASEARLHYLRTGNSVQSGLWFWFFDKFAPLLATGGPGASRVILLSACIFFLGATETSSFSGDFFIVMLLNTAFSQCFGFFLLKADYVNSFRAVIKQSIKGLVSSLLLVFFLAKIGLISQMLYSMGLLSVLHFYYIYRYENISKHTFTLLAISEILISILCLFLPFFANKLNYTGSYVPYEIYLIALFAGFLILFFYSKSNEQSEHKHISFKRLKNISISTTTSIFAVFVLPASIKMIASPEIVSVVALAISCISISMLFPRTYANKILKLLAQPTLDKKKFHSLSSSYARLMFVSAGAGLIITIAYLLLVTPVIDNLVLTVPLAITIVLVSSQLGFISLTYLSLQGADQKVAQLNLAVLVITLIFIAPTLLGIVNNKALIYVSIFVTCSSFMLRNKIAKKNTESFLN